MNPLALLGGALFGAGVCISGMVKPSKVLGFLDFAGSWDPTLLVVMASALAVTIVAWRVVARRTSPVLGGSYPPPPSPLVDARLIVGAALFGVGWGLSGYCPGPALVAVVAGVPATFVFVATMLAGMFAIESREAATRPDA